MSRGHSNLYVGSLPEGITEEAFQGIFQPYGNIESTKLFADNQYGFVKFASTEEATAAESALNGSTVQGSKITVRPADNDRGQGGRFAKGKGGGMWQGGWQGPGENWDGRVDEPTPNDNLHMTGLPPNMTEEALYSIFGAYGTIQSIKVLNTNGTTEDGRGMTICMVRLGSVEQATWMVQNLNGNIPQGLTTPITVRYADTPDVKSQKQARKPYGGGKGKGYPMQPFGGKGGGPMNLGPRPQFSSGGDDSNLYVKGLPAMCDDLYLYKLFAPYGAIQSVRVIVEDGRCSGIGFVKFSRKEEAQWAIRQLSGCVMEDGTPLTVSIKAPGRRQQEGGRPM